MNRILMRIALLCSWLWIALPLAWGVYNSALKSLPLFTHPSAFPAASGPPAQPATPTSIIPPVR